MERQIKMNQQIKKYYSSNTAKGLEKIKFEDSLIPINVHKDVIGVDIFGALIHYHPEYEILYCIKGKVNIICNNVPMTLTENHILFISPYLLHSISVCDENECTYYCFLIDRQFLNSIIKLDDCTFYSMTDNAKIIENLKEIIAEYSRKQQKYVDVCRGLITTCFARLFRTESVVISANIKYDIVNKITAYIEENYNNKIDLKDICKITNFSTSRLCTVFKQATGSTITNYINQIRCKHAYYMISSGDFNVSEAASVCGFNSFSYFSKTYYDLFGELPSDTKRRISGSN